MYIRTGTIFVIPIAYFFLFFVYQSDHMKNINLTNFINDKTDKNYLV
jgi:hypothetical protein